MRRIVLYATAVFLLCTGVAAQTNVIKLIVPYAPGSSTDAGARVLAQKIGERLNQTIVVENRPGSVGEIGTAECARAAPDGRTLCYIADGQAATMPAARVAAGHTPRYHQLSPIGLVSDSHFVFVTRKGRPSTLEEFLAYVRTHENELACGSGNPTGKLGIAFFNKVGFKVRDIPYGAGGEPAVHVDMQAGVIDCMFSTMFTAQEFIKAGRLNAIASAGPVKNPFLTVPALSDLYPIFGKLPTWYGLFGPPGLESATVERLNRALNTTLSNSEVVSLFHKNGHTPKTSTPIELGKLVWQQYGETIALIKDTGVVLVGD